MPTDAAFAALPRPLRNRLRNNIPELKKIVLSHVTNGGLIGPLIRSGTATKSLSGNQLHFSKVPDGVGISFHRIFGEIRFSVSWCWYKAYIKLYYVLYKPVCFISKTKAFTCKIHVNRIGVFYFYNFQPNHICWWRWHFFSTVYPHTFCQNTIWYVIGFWSLYMSTACP